ncbi:iron ABC transporter permease [Rhodobacteraceae bacterium CCMM004]|nr:iron ABC transporter permease [Rhodobacteraceae bacterium CCMM004]
MRPAVPALIAASAGLALASLHLGVRFTPPGEVLAALAGRGEGQAALIVQSLRLPRAVLAVVVGASLGLAGLLMQTAVRNPIAEPGLLGVNAGAAFAVVLLLTLVPGAAMTQVMLTAALGAAVAVVCVMGLALSTASGMSPVFLLLAGVTIAALLNAGLQVLILLDEAVMEELLFWLAGAFVDRPIDGLWIALPLLALVALAVVRFRAALDVLGTDDATAATLGVDVLRTRLGFLGAVALLSGASVALAGPIAFVGLVAPHLARLSGGRGTAALLPLTMLWGAVLAQSSDILARFVLYPSEAPVSAVMAMVGVPLLVLLLRRRRIAAA